MNEDKTKKMIVSIIILLVLCHTIRLFIVNSKNEISKIEVDESFYPYANKIVHDIYGKDAEKMAKIVTTPYTYSGVVYGSADMIISTKPSDEEKEFIDSSGAELVYQLLFLEPLAIITNKENNIDNLTIDQIKGIYNSNNDEWNTYQLEKDNASQTAFETIIKNNEINEHHYEVKTMKELIDKIAEDKNGIGYVFNSYYSKTYSNDNVKKININNKYILDKDYPLQFEVYLIYRDGLIDTVLSDIKDWIRIEESTNIG